MSEKIETPLGFESLNLSAPLLQALNSTGYETPTPIQAQTIPHILAGRDVVGQAQTGTGKTAAFALPILSRVDLRRVEPQVLVLAPTRELAIQVAEAFQRYAAFLKGFHVLPIYGGQAYAGQLRQLKRGVHVIVGTPGRVMDHIERGTLQLAGLTQLVLDEADEMLRMGFQEDVEWIMERIPEKRQIALFSATMPPPIRRIAQQYLNDPVEITIKMPTSTAETIHHRFAVVAGIRNKLETLTRILEVEDFDGMIVFVRTKTTTVELAEKLEARGFASAALNGDINQNQREKTVEAFKAGKLDILVATDVAARGLDVDRISHVINFDIPYDTEAYVHRVGRTGRAGRQGKAILLVAPREKHLLRAIEKATRQKMEAMVMPTVKAVNARRVSQFKERIFESLTKDDLEFFQQLVAEFHEETDIPPLTIAAALAKMVQGEKPMLLENEPEKPARFREEEPRQKGENRRPGGFHRDSDKVRYRVEVGSRHGIKPGNLVGAITGEAGISGSDIGRIDIFDKHSLLDLPGSLPFEVLEDISRIRMNGHALQISRAESRDGFETFRKKAKGKGRGMAKAVARQSGGKRNKSK
ncbi:MAG: DEAD/DEAH box helicase [Calditrichaeota bacterium]|nr:DEAD/DEAH box helicase [Calditrichota bacterium]HQU72026.1 DEAD/DEAH box helicase [Calditrichia bacterium]